MRIKFKIILFFLIESNLIIFSNTKFSSNLKNEKGNEIKIENDEIIDLNPEGLPTKDDANIEYVAILHTNDIHGSFYPKTIRLPSGKTYTTGGLEYLASYVEIMQKSWSDHFIYFDSGDQFQGGLESRISDGKIIMNYFNYLKVNKAAIGNHEFDYGIDFLKNYTNSAKFQFLSSNIMEKKTGSFEVFPNQIQTAIIPIGDKIKIGIIGIATQETVVTTSTDVSGYIFYGYPDIIKEKSKELKNKGVNAVIVLAHVGMYCRVESDDIKLEFKLRNKQEQTADCNIGQEAYDLLKKLDSDTIDLFLAGHKHDVGHNWINGIPFVSNDRNGKFADIVYLPFDRTTGKFLKEKLLMEGPLPICEKIFTKNKRCDMSIPTLKDEENYGNATEYKFHGVPLKSNEEVKKIGEEFREKYNEYDSQLLTITNDHFESNKDAENAMGNFYTDFLRHISGAEIAIINPGSFRIPFYIGNITNSTIYTFDPFGGNIVMFKATGIEIKKILRQLQAGKKGFYPVSGLRLSLKKNPHKLLTVKRYEGGIESELIDSRDYTIVTNEFCIPLKKGKHGGDDFYPITHWFKPRDIKQVMVNGVKSSRDLLMNYLRNIPLLEAKKYYDPKNPRTRIL